MFTSSSILSRFDAGLHAQNVECLYGCRIASLLEVGQEATVMIDDYWVWVFSYRGPVKFIVDTPLDGLFINVEPHCQSKGIIVVIVTSLTVYRSSEWFSSQGQSAVTTLTALIYVIGWGAWVRWAGSRRISWRRKGIAVNAKP